MSLLQDVVSFFLWVAGTYAVGAASQLYVYFKTGAVFYKSGQRKAMSKLPDAVWYMKLARDRITPGTVAVTLAWAAGYLFFGYGVWRVWIADAARESNLGIALAAVALVHWASVPLSVWLTFGCESLVLGMLGQILNLGSATVVMALAWQLQENGVAPLIGAGVALSVYAAIHLAACVVHVALLVGNPGTSKSGVI